MPRVVRHSPVMKGLRALLLLLSVMALASCGKAPDPQFSAQNGDLGIFVLTAISNREPSLDGFNGSPIQTTWQSRVLTDRHRSGKYLDGRQALQIATASTNFTSLEALLNQRLGPATMPLRQEQGGWRHVGWKLRQDVAVWLHDDGQQCTIEVVRPKPQPKT